MNLENLESPAFSKQKRKLKDKNNRKSIPPTSPSKPSTPTRSSLPYRSSSFTFQLLEQEDNSAENSKVFLSFDDIKYFGFNSGCVAVLMNESNKEKTCGVLWPSSEAKASNIEINKRISLNLNLKPSDRISISSLQTPLTESPSIVIRPNFAEFAVDEGFQILMQQYIVGLKYVHLNMKIEITHNTQQLQFTVTQISVSKNLPEFETSDLVVFRVSQRTKIDFAPAESSRSIKLKSDVSYASIGGLSEKVDIIREMVELPLKNPQRFKKYGLKPPRGVLLYGPPGTGKTLIARAVAAETGAHVITINGAEVISRFFGETEARLRSIFDEAYQNTPAIIFIDEIDALCPKREEAATELERRIVASLLTLIDRDASSDYKLEQSDQKQQITPQGGVVVIAATNRVNAIDDALRRPGRFDRELEIGIPTPKDRVEIMRVHLKNSAHSITDEEIESIAFQKLHGYVGADIAAVCREAAVRALKRSIKQSNTDTLRITFEDLNNAVGDVRPSAMREVMIEVPKVKWTDIGGQEHVKQKLKEAIEWPLKHPEAFARFGIRPPKGILMYGPPGCSKTLMAKALATEGGLNFLAVKGPELFSKWVGESEKAVREVFRKARAASPSIIFFDEIDALAVRRSGGDSGTSVSDRVLSQLLSEMDGIEPLVNVTVVAATNRPDILDSAMLRPGRIDRLVYVGPPDVETRKQILRIKMKAMAVDKNVNITELAEMMESFSGAEVASVCQEAAILAISEDENVEKVSQNHFVSAVRGITPQITPAMIKFYEDFSKRSGLKNV